MALAGFTKGKRSISGERGSMPNPKEVLP